MGILSQITQSDLDWLHSHLRRLVAGNPPIEDAIQDALLIADQKFDPSRGTIRNFLLQCAKHRMIRYYLGYHSRDYQTPLQRTASLDEPVSNSEPDDPATLGETLPDSTYEPDPDRIAENPRWLAAVMDELSYIEHDASRPRQDRLHAERYRKMLSKLRAMVALDILDLFPTVYQGKLRDDFFELMAQRLSRGKDSVSASAAMKAWYFGREIVAHQIERIEGVAPR